MRVLKIAALFSILFLLISMRAEADVGISVTLGSQFTIFAADMAIDQFSEKPVAFIQYVENGKPRQRSLKIVGPDRFPSNHIVCEWSLAKMPNGSYQLWVQPKSGLEVENPVLASQTINVMLPVISSIFKNASHDRLIVTGHFFGTRPPTVRLTYVESSVGKDDGGNIIKKDCRVLRPLAYANGEGVPNRSCMDVETGESRVAFDLPDGLPENTEFKIIVENRIGCDAAIWNPDQRIGADLTMAVYPEQAGTTDPPAGETVQVNTDFSVEITAVPAEGYHFVRWEGTENAVIPDKVTAGTRIDLWWNATVTAHFEKNPPEIEFDGIMSAAGVRYVEQATGETLSQVALSWNPARDNNTMSSKIRYHIYRGDTDDFQDVYQEYNRVTTVSGGTEINIDVPLSKHINYFLMVAEDGEGNINRNHRLTKVVQHLVEFQMVPKVLEKMIASQIHFDPFGTVFFDGDYGSSFRKGDVILLNMGYWKALKLINEVVVQEGVTYLDTRNAPFDTVIASGVLETVTCPPWIEEAMPDSVSSGFNHSEVIDQNTVFDYNIKFKPTIRSRAEYVSDHLDGVSITLKGTFRMNGKLECTFSGDDIKWDQSDVIKKLSAARYFLGIIPIYNEIELVLNGYMNIKGPKGEHMITDIDFEKEIMLTIQWDGINGWIRKDESREMTYSMPCYPDAPGDIDLDFIVSPHLKMSYNGHSAFDYCLRPQASVWALEIDKASGTEFQQFDIIGNTGTGTEISYGIFSQNLTNTWKDEWDGPDKRRKIFSLPDMYELSLYNMHVSEEQDISIVWREGVHNSVLRGNGADIWWHTTLDGVEYAYLSLSGAPYHDSDNRNWHQKACFIPRRFGTYQVKVMMKGDGFLGDLGTVSSSATIKVDLPPFPN